MHIDEEGLIVFSCCASIKALASDLPPIDTSSNADSGAQLTRHSLKATRGSSYIPASSKISCRGARTGLTPTPQLTCSVVDVRV